MSDENVLCCCNHHLRHIDKTIHYDGYWDYYLVLLSPTRFKVGLFSEEPINGQLYLLVLIISNI